MHFGCALILALTASQVAPQADGTGRIAGRITVEGTNAPVAGAVVTLSPVRRMRPLAPGRMPPQALTDRDGRFAFDRIIAGAYFVDAQKTGFVSLRQPGRASAVTVEVAAGGATTTLELQMQRGGVVSGRVLDPSGEPLADAHVLAMQPIPAPAGAAPQSAPRLVPAGSGAQTNDLGEFRVAGLAAGQYYIVATPRGGSPFGGPGVAPPSTAPHAAMAATFYPGTIDDASAQPVVVTAGGETPNISFTMQSAPAFRVSGIVVDESGEPVPNAIVMMIGTPRVAYLGTPAGGQSRPDGRFTIDEVMAGTYRVTASLPIQIGRGGSGGSVTWSSGGAAASGVAGGGGSVSGGVAPTDQATQVTVTDADVSGVRVVVRRPDRQ